MASDALNVWNDWYGKSAETFQGINEDGPILCIKWSNSPLFFLNNVSLNGQDITSENIESSIALATQFLKSKTDPGCLWIFEESFTPGIWSAILPIAETAGWFVAMTVAIMTNVVPDNTIPYPSSGDLHPQLSIRRAETVEDLEAYSDLLAGVHGTPMELGRQAFSTRFFLDQNYTYLARLDGVVVSGAAVGEAAGWLHIACVATAADQRKKGYATAVMEVAIRNAVVGTGIRKLMLQTEEINQPLYERMGFKKTSGDGRLMLLNGEGTQ
jgi:GNAT superfamily N-acetyltransferase